MKETISGFEFEAHPEEGKVVLGEGGVEDFGSGVLAEASAIPDMQESQEVMEKRLDREQKRNLNMKIGKFLLNQEMK
ncbi:hypothetical protein FWF89_02920 [Candidatus Saccharibacteria bacterium]|nr:hypothetical protein [Candidatus Saccharibacteria bacterium]